MALGSTQADRQEVSEPKARLWGHLLFFKSLFFPPLSLSGQQFLWPKAEERALGPEAAGV